MDVILSKSETGNEAIKFLGSSGFCVGKNGFSIKRRSLFSYGLMHV
jgi:hypothetical protein